MPIEMRRDVQNARWCPVFVCDACSDVIQHHDEGNACWLEVNGVRAQLIFLHKQPCYLKADARWLATGRQEDYLLTDPIHVLWADLGHNAKIDYKDAEEDSQTLGEL